MRCLALLWLPALVAAAENPKPCASPSAYTPCDFVFELNDAEAGAHPNPYRTVTMHMEFRSPRHRTISMPAFWDGGRRLAIRFSPTEPGEWAYKVTSNVARFDDAEGKLTAAESPRPGFIRTANVHHWAYTENNKPHLWMGDTCYPLASLDMAEVKRIADTRAAQKFNHLRFFIAGSDPARAYPSPETPDPEFFRAVDERIEYLNAKGITADLILGRERNQLVKQFPDWRQRERYLQYIAARYAPMDVVWEGVERWETYDDGRQLLKEIGTVLKRFDAYQHPRSSDSAVTSAPLLPDGWMNFVLYRTADNQLGTVEHQLYPVPFVNAGFAIEQGGNTDAFRRALWNSSMDGQYPTLVNARLAAGSTDELDSPAAKQMGAWFDFYSDNRHWELEPYFDVDGARAVALEEIEYIVYVEKPSGPIELAAEKHGYNVAWVDPATGDRQPLKNWKGERFVGEPPSSAHDWVLHVSREGRKEGMLKSYKFESRPVPLQEIEMNPQKVVFQIAEPAEDITLAHPARFAAKLTRQTRATRAMTYLWTGEVVPDGQGFRVLGTGPSGTFTIPEGIAKNYPAVLSVHVVGMNANGKAYAADRVYRLTR